MYNLNKLMRNVLITPQEVLFHAQTKHTVDMRMIEQSIIIAEERFIVEEIGFDFYESLATAKNTLVTEANLEDLQTKIGSGFTLKAGDLVNASEFLDANSLVFWNRHLWKLLAECVMATAFPEGFVQFSSEGAFHTVPPAGLMVTSGLVTPTLGSMKWSMDTKLQSRIGPLVNSMHNFLCKYKKTYGFNLYYRECDCDRAAKEQFKATDLILSIYDDVDDYDDDCC